MASTLSAAEWKKVLKAHPKAEDAAALTKALENYARANGDPKPRLEALEAVVTRAEASKKKNAKTAEVADFLDGLIAEARKEIATTSRAARKQTEDENEDDGVGGADLKKSLLKARQLDPENARPFVLALGGVAGLAIAKRPPITRDHRNSAKEMRTGKGKLLLGRCYGEGGQYVFEFEEKPAGGLTKVIKKAVKLHAGMEIKLKVRGGGHEIDDEHDDAELNDFGVEAEDAAPPQAAAAPADVFKAKAQAVKAALDQLKAADPGKAAELMTQFAAALGHAQAKRFDQGLADLKDVETRLNAAAEKPAAGAVPGAGAGAAFATRLKELLQGAVKAGLPRADADQVKLLASEAQGFARKNEFGRANALLDDVAGRLDRAPGQSPDKAAEAGEVEEDLAAATGRSIAYWQAARDRVDAQINALCGALRKTGDEALGEAAEKLTQTMSKFKVGLQTSLANFDAADGKKKRQWHAKATGLIAAYRKHVAESSLITAADTNPFGIEVTARQDLIEALDRTQKHIDKQVA